MIRLDRLLASLGHGSRREVRRLLAEGRVAVAGVIVTDPELKVDAAGVRLDGEPLEAPGGLLAVLHKPAGYVCTHADGEGPAIYDLLPERWLRRHPPVTSVGRLDKDTSGVILVTDRGDLVQRWTSPKSDIEKVYEADLDRPLSPGLVGVFASGTLMLRGEDKPCLPGKLEILGERTARLTITEGRYHQVRRMFASQGWRVERLHRLRFGPYGVEALGPGEWRMLPLPAAEGNG